MNICLSGPSPARDVVVDPRRHNGTSELHISWNPPLKPNGEVTHYEVYWQPQPFHAEKYHQRNYCDDSKIISSPLQTLKLAQFIILQIVLHMSWPMMFPLHAINIRKS